MIVLDNISFSYRKSKPVLSDLSLKIESGSIAGLLGRNGVGKSTMLYLIAGLLKPQTGAHSFSLPWSLRAIYHLWV